MKSYFPFVYPSTALKYAVRTATMFGTEVMINLSVWNPHDRISEGLFLGMIVVKEAQSFMGVGSGLSHQEEKIVELVNESNAQRPLKLVVSVVESDELEGDGFARVKSMMSTEDWEKLGVKHIKINVADFSAKVETNDIKSAVYKMRECIQKEDGSVYGHCKAGRSRSALLFAVYLALFGSDPKVDKRMTLDEACQLMKKGRKQVQLEGAQKKRAGEIICEISVGQTPKLLNALKLPAIKKAVADSKEISELKKHVVSSSSSFFTSPKYSGLFHFVEALKEEGAHKWFFELMHPLGSLAAFDQDKKEGPDPRIEKLRADTIQILKEEKTLVGSDVTELVKIFKDDYAIVKEEKTLVRSDVTELVKIFKDDYAIVNVRPLLEKKRL